MSRAAPGSRAYDFRSAERRAQELWRKRGSLKAKRSGGGRRFTCMALPTELAERISLGHCRNHVITDVVARQQRMLGRSVLHAGGWDANGIQAQLAARDAGETPAAWSRRCERRGRELLERLGIGIDWDRAPSTASADQRRAQQELFLALWQAGDLIAPERSEGVAYWDPGARAFLSLRQLVNGRGPESGMLVEIRKVKSYDVEISPSLASDLLRGLERLPRWDSFVRNMQRESIGRELGLTISFPVHDPGGRKWPALQVFTSRPDTLMGTTFLAVGARHRLALQVAEEDGRIAEFCAEINEPTYAYRKMAEDKRQEGMPLGLYAVNPVNGDHIPIWVANFVVAGYGTEALLGVPAHDQRNFNFALRHNLPMRRVEEHSDAGMGEPLLRPITDKQALPSGGDALSDALRRCKLELLAELERLRRREPERDPAAGSAWRDRWDGEVSACVAGQLAEHGIEADQTAVTRLRDWKISTQSYWGTPVPLIHCDGCGAVPVPKKDLPVELPAYREGKDSLADYPRFVATRCPRCGDKARRDTDTLASLFDTSSLHAGLLGRKAGDRLPVDFFCCGVENATSHLLCMRLLHRLMRELGLVSAGAEPVEFLLSQGMVLNYGLPMSTAYANAIEPHGLLDEFGADTLRLYLGASEDPRRALHWDDQKLFALQGILTSREFAALRAGKLEGIKLDQARDCLSPRDFGRLTEGLLDRSEFAALRSGRLSGGKARAAERLIGGSGIERLRNGMLSSRDLKDLRGGRLPQERMAKLEGEFSELEINRLQHGMLSAEQLRSLCGGSPPAKLRRKAAAAIGEENLRKVMAANADPDRPGAIAKLQEDVLDAIERKELDSVARDRDLLLRARSILDENEIASLQRGLLGADDFKALRGGRLKGAKLRKVKDLLSNGELERITKGVLERGEMMLFRRGRLPAKRMAALARRLGKRIDLRRFQARSVDRKRLAAAKASLPDRRRLELLRAGELPEGKLASLRRMLGAKQLEEYLGSLMDERTFSAAAGFIDPERQALLVNFIEPAKQRALDRILSPSEQKRLRALGSKRPRPPLLGFLDRRRMDRLLRDLDGGAMDRLVNFVDPGKLEPLLGFTGMLWHVVAGKAEMVAAAGSGRCRDGRRVRLHDLINSIELLYSGSPAAAEGDESRLCLNRAVNRSRDLLALIEETADIGSPDDCALVAEGIDALLRLLHPLIPHVTEQLWQHLGLPSLLAEAKWPKANRRLLEKSGDQNVVVQENGRVQLSFTAAADAPRRRLRSEAESRLEAKARLRGFPRHPRMGRKVMRVEYASRRRESVINFVVAPDLER